MRRFVATLAVAGFLATPARSATAQTNIDFFAQFAPTSTVLYLPFAVSVGGTFGMQTSGLNLVDPMLRLFSGASLTGAGLGTSLAANDDGAPASAGWNICTGAGGTCHSLISIFLAPGEYTLAMSVFNLTEAEARAGAATFGADADYPTYCNADQNWSDCNFSTKIFSNVGQASVVPEPASIVLLATGLAGLAGAAKRRRKNL